MKISVAIAGAVMLAGSLAACSGGDGGGESSGYCKELKTASTKFDSLSSGDATQLDAAFTSFHTLADKAPSDIKGDWNKLDGAITDVEKALKDAGLKFSDFDKIQKGEIPEGVDVSKLAGLASEFTKLNNAEFSKATDNIVKHAKDVCKVTLSTS